MVIKIEINLDNAAFYKDNDVELSRILAEFAESCKHAQITPDHGNFRDVNGNKVGTWEIFES